MSLRQPKRYPVKFYSWADKDAPQLANSDGVIKTILKACLVTGYGDKQGAGWEMPFEDEYRMVLRMPMRTGNPPDYKIENGMVGGVIKHRIIAQNNPTSLDDARELVAYNLLAKDARCGKEWYVFATDFAVMLCYQMGYTNSALSDNHLKNNLLYLGAIQKLNDAENEYFMLGTQGSATPMGESSNSNLGAINVNAFVLMDIRNNRNMLLRTFVAITGMTEMQTGDYLAQPIWIESKAKLPFYCAMCENNITRLNGLKTHPININSRPFLRYINMPGHNYQGFIALYVPMDYWEL